MSAPNIWTAIEDSIRPALRRQLAEMDFDLRDYSGGRRWVAIHRPDRCQFYTGDARMVEAHSPDALVEKCLAHAEEDRAYLSDLAYCKEDGL